MRMPKKTVGTAARRRTTARKPGATTLSTKGQVVIPKDMRDDLGWTDGDALIVEVDGDGLRMQRVARHEPLPVAAVSGMLKPLLKKGAARLPESEWRDRVDEMLRKEHLAKRRVRR